MAKFRMLLEKDGFKPGPHDYLDRKTGARKTINPGDEIECHPDELKNVMHKFERIDGETAPPAPPVAKLIVKAREGGGFDLINPVTNQPINSLPLKKADADALADKSAAEAGALLKK